MQVVVIAGSGGIGLALVKLLCQRADVRHITATWHKHKQDFSHPKLTWQQLDLNNEQQIAALFERAPTLDWLINCAGVLHSQQLKPEKSLSQCQADNFMLSMQLNALPSLLLAKHAAKPLKTSDDAKFVSVSAKVGSISDNRLGGWHSYRSAKAALNMVLKNIAIEWQRSHPKVCVTAWHPGTTDTELSKPFQRNVPAGKLLSSQQSASLLLEKLVQLKPENTGQFWAWDGSQIGW
ncbi:MULTISPECIES: SDR family NAD(P)-dependent oxidoreductase [unclassified Agarivorans]|uniref:SDR family NAD(P)-dependent oxidoreductase n=1 Tax=unclassified Agarivorans TaxID=2636026 RepID=UPI0026E39AC2|nr:MULTISPECIES: SDR family NAD(P)-dependent oxidoreductase [unclassified Agarivorans]MDO6683996.1 SDR family NAD(P)-dependent oxidoreductase [Agarivorans sp. 3_MG-2023]MDO6714271.1 SDR family NAD(P)-dependent oxidoreductase [Agarivorans sp. 2_MG-2023]